MENRGLFTPQKSAERATWLQPSSSTINAIPLRWSPPRTAASRYLSGLKSLPWSRRTGLTCCYYSGICTASKRSEEHTSELQSRENLVCRLLLEKKNYDVALE